MIKSGLSILLSLFVLIGSIHLPIYKHTCHVFDKSEIAIFHEKDCCFPDENSKEQFVDFKCCSVDELGISLSVESTIDSNTQFQYFAPSINEMEQLSFEPLISYDEDLPVLRPPPLANRDIHNLYQTYLI